MRRMNHLGIICFVLIIVTTCKNSDEKDVKSQEKPVIPVSNISVQSYWEGALNGELNTVQKALEGGIQVDTINENGSTAMMLAAFNGHAEIVEMLLEEGANVNHHDYNHRTALMYASSGPAIETVELLLKEGAKVNVRDSVEGFTAVMFAAAEGQTDVFKALLEAGADLSMKDKDGETARDFAMNNGHAEIVDLTTSYQKK